MEDKVLCIVRGQQWNVVLSLREYVSYSPGTSTNKGMGAGAWVQGHGGLG